MSGILWAADDRPTQPCVVCHGAPDRTIELPELPDVHIAFGSSAVCADCADAAQANDAAELTRRARGGWSDDEDDVVADLVRLVLTAFGHRPPAKPLPPAEFRQPSPQPLSPADAAIWAELEPLMYDGPGHEVVVHGRITYQGDGQTSDTLVELAGSRARLANADGRPWLVTDGVTMWRADPSGGVMVAQPYRGDGWAGEGSELACRRSRGEVDLFGFGRPIGPLEPIDYLGRPAWRFAFAAPSHKPNDMKVVVDAETGLVLEQRFGAFSIARWTEFVTESRVDDERFRWVGPVVTHDEVEAEHLREHEADMARRSAWFTAHVTSEPLSVSGQAVSVQLHTWEADGSFEASLDGGLDGALARRPRSTEWWPLGWSSVTHRWTDDHWDWALSVWDFDHTEPITPPALAELQQALGRPPHGG